MDDRIKKLLTEQRHKLGVNKNAQMNISLDSKRRPIPENKLNETVNVGDQFDLERQSSSLYRFYGNIKSLVSNPLFNDNIKLFQRTDENDVLHTKAVPVNPNNIVEQDGWFGYFDDDSDTAKEYIEDAADFNDNKSTLCELFPFDPGPDRLKFDDPDGLPNYSLKITYPSHNLTGVTFLENGQGVSLNDGIPVVEAEEKIINERSYTVLKTPFNHGLNTGDIIRLYHMGDLTYDPDKLNEYQVIQLGDVGGLNKDRSFVIDINYIKNFVDQVSLDKTVTTLKRVVNDVTSDYYLRSYKSITTSKTDYDLFPTSYATTMYGDEEVGFNFKVDVDVGNLRDNLKRPLSEIFLTICKLGDEDNNNNDFKDQHWFDEQAKSEDVVAKGLENNFWTEKCGGFKTDNYEGVKYNVRAISSDEEIKGEDFADSLGGTSTTIVDVDESLAVSREVSTRDITAALDDFLYVAINSQDLAKINTGGGIFIQDVNPVLDGETTYNITNNHAGYSVNGQVVITDSSYTYIDGVYFDNVSFDYDNWTFEPGDWVSITDYTVVLDKKGNDYKKLFFDAPAGSVNGTGWPAGGYPLSEYQHPTHTYFNYYPNTSHPSFNNNDHHILKIPRTSLPGLSKRDRYRKTPKVGDPLNLGTSIGSIDGIDWCHKYTRQPIEYCKPPGGSSIFGACPDIGSWSTSPDTLIGMTDQEVIDNDRTNLKFKDTGDHWEPMSWCTNKSSLNSGIVSVVITELVVNQPTLPPNNHFCGIKCDDDSFIGDISEYNSSELNERMLEPIYHRFNSVYREYRKSILGIDEGLELSGDTKDITNLQPLYEIDDLREGYLYRPHYRIKIREFSSFIESGDAKKVIGIPDYATLSYSGDTGETEMYRWRDFLDIGFYDELGKGVDYAFLSGAHYLYLDTRFYLERQDPPCNVNTTQVDFEMKFPADDANDPNFQKFNQLVNDPRFYDFIVYGVNDDGEIAETDSDDLLIEQTLNVTVILIDYDGEYSLGNREIPGDCVDLPLIERITIDDVC